ncbi:hypothetical protein NPIL_613431 [Nephila pilipes]|uniref:PiggyBac transposable element-derived protein domain-containing protein n=1 Tax=Nephila pilipes TaxID=299642 RepID=A0A8X6PY48_NEPPI|nr:hypothetical protein NPIL_613431 [Nephila pilipes]
MLNAIPCVGKDDTRPENISLSDYVVLLLMKPILGKGKIFTTDNVFISATLAAKLKIKYTIIVVPTMKQSRKGILEATKYSKHLLYSVSYSKHNDSNLTEYQC